MPRKLKVFRYACAGFQKIGYASSQAAFRRLTGGTLNDTAYTSVSGNPADLKLADEAGEGYYMDRQRDGTYARKRSQEAIAQDALDAAKGASGGNTPPVRIERGKSVNTGFSHEIDRLVFIGGDQRGYWRRLGSRWTLYDMTGWEVPSDRSFNTHSDGSIHEYDHSPMRIIMRGWDEAASYHYVTHVWQNGDLPPLDEQKARAEKRDNAHRQKRARKAAMERLLIDYDKLARVLVAARDAGNPEAGDLIELMTLVEDDEK